MEPAENRNSADDRAAAIDAFVLDRLESTDWSALTKRFSPQSLEQQDALDSVRHAARGNEADRTTVANAIERFLAGKSLALVPTAAAEELRWTVALHTIDDGAQHEVALQKIIRLHEMEQVAARAAGIDFGELMRQLVQTDWYREVQRRDAELTHVDAYRDMRRSALLNTQLAAQIAPSDTTELIREFCNHEAAREVVVDRLRDAIEIGRWTATLEKHPEIDSPLRVHLGPAAQERRARANAVWLENRQAREIATALRFGTADLGGGDRLVSVDWTRDRLSDHPGAPGPRQHVPARADYEEQRLILTVMKEAGASVFFQGPDDMMIDSLQRWLDGYVEKNGPVRLTNGMTALSLQCAQNDLEALPKSWTSDLARRSFDELRAAGVRTYRKRDQDSVPFAIIASANEYLENHPELHDQQVSRIHEIVLYQGTFRLGDGSVMRSVADARDEIRANHPGSPDFGDAAPDLVDEYNQTVGMLDLLESRGVDVIRLAPGQTIEGAMDLRYADEGLDRKRHISDAIAQLPEYVHRPGLVVRNCDYLTADDRFVTVASRSHNGQYVYCNDGGAKVVVPSHCFEVPPYRGQWVEVLGEGRSYRVVPMSREHSLERS